MTKKLLFPILLLCQVLAAQQPKTNLSWPEITRENKPWTRWWWPGSIVNPSDLLTNMEKYRKAGLGGLELTVIYGVKGMEDKFINYLSPDWMKMFAHTLNEAKRLGLGVDLANSSSWPFGGPWVTNADASKTVTYKIWSLKEGESLKEPVIYIQEPSIKLNGSARPEITALIDPVYKNKDLQTLAIDQIKFQKPIPLQILMAYPETGQALDLTDKVDGSGKLNWTAPTGTWTLYGVFQGWHGKMVERAGPGGEGYVIDHFSGNAISNYLKRFDDAFKGSDLSYLRGYFNDSYEVDDARGQSCWTPEMFNEFRIRRGYDLSQNLPALFQKDNPEKNARVLCDYRQTISDLILEKFTTIWTNWAHNQGKITRDQAHGSPGNILDLYAAADIPETEGAEFTKLKFATSAGNVTGKKYVSSESATWLNEHFSSSLSDVKKAINLFFIAGVNHIFYHGTCFSPVNQPWPGFQFYAAVEFSPQNSFWNDFEGLNKYVSRVQSFLQKGKPDNDILLYFPIFDRYSDFGRDLLEHFDAVNPKYNGTPFRTAADAMLDKGYTYDYISDLQLKNTQSINGLLKTTGGVYKTVIIPGCKYVPLETFERVLKLAEGGGQVIFFGDMPENIAGWYDYQNKSEIYSKLKSELKFGTTENKDVKKAFYGEGTILSGDNLDQLLSYAAISREKMVDNSIIFNRRKYENGYYYFLVNKGTKPFDGWLELSEKVKSAALFNPLTDKYGIAEIRAGSDGLTEIYTQMNPEESLIIETFNTTVAGKPYNFYEPASASQEISGTWKVEFTEGGPEMPSLKKTNKLISWTDLDGDTLKNFSGTARYTISFKRPAGKAEAYLLDLGKVCNSARVSLNGKEVAILIGPDFNLLLDKSQFRSTNTLELKVSNLMANRIAYLDRNGVGWKKFYNVNMAARLKENSKNGIFDASAWQPRESGLLGPVTITPLKKH